MLRVAKVVPCTSAEGPFERVAIWVAGCDLACPGCCNPELFDSSAGAPMTRAQQDGLLDEAVVRGVEGITVLGGEPLQQREALAQLLEAAAERGLGTLVFSGYTLEQAHDLPGFAEVWGHVDTLVDGRFDVHQRERARRFIGSANQRLHHRTPRYAAPALWVGPARLEVRIGPDGTVEGHGLPGPLARLRRAVK